MIVNKESMFSGKSHEMEIDVTNKEIALWMEGSLIQDVMPNLTANEREFLMTGVTPAEWKQMESAFTWGEME
jgi:hypothetical protein